MKRLFYSSFLSLNAATLLLITCSCLGVGATASAAVEKADKLEAADELLGHNQSIDAKYDFEFRGLPFVGYPNVYSPVIFPGASKQTDIPVHEGESFLELGSGTGIFSVIAALNGAEKVWAVDINPDAIANTQENAALHHVSDRLTAVEGDMFAPIPEGELFDVIFFNIPFCHRACDVDDLSMLGRSLFDPEHDLLHRYFRDGHKHLAEGGRMILGYSTTHGDVELMHQWANLYGWDVTLLHKLGDETIDFITVELYEFRQRDGKHG